MWLTLAPMLALVFTRTASAHDADFGVTAISVAPGHPEMLWAVTRGWGILRSADAGTSWQWYCEEGLGLSTLYDIEALDDGRALLAGVSGLLILDPECGQTPLPGLPEGSFPAEIRRYGEGWLVSAYSEAESGAYFCTLEGCAPTELVGADVYLKSFAPDGTGTLGEPVWATTVTPGTLAAVLWRSTDGEHWSHVYSWADGTVDPRVLHARGDRLFVWAQARDEDHVPSLLRSEDGGQSWATVLAFGAFSDDGESWIDINDYHPEVPTVRCVSDDGAWVCGDHFADGYDIARVVGFGFDAVACMDDATPAECLGGSCDTYYEDFLARGEYGGGACVADLTPPPTTTGCGAQGAAAGALGVASGYMSYSQLRRRRRQLPSARG